MEKKNFPRSAVIGVAIAALSVGGLGGAALAVGPTLFAPSGVTAEGSVPAPAPEYKANAEGLTYGSALDAVSPETEPDLVLVEATNGKQGYAYKSDLDRASGADVVFKSPEEALAWQKEQAKVGPRAVPVYEVDGKTVIGQFMVGS